MNNLKIEVWDQLHRINNIMMPEPHKGHEKPLIGRGQVKILKEIMKESNLSQDDLAKKARVDKSIFSLAAFNSAKNREISDNY